MDGKLLTKSTQYLAIICLIGSFLILTPTVQAVSCPDSIVECWCDNNQMVCTHQLPSCTKVTETHSEMPGAASCIAPSPLPTGNTIVAGVGGGPVSSSAPVVIAAQSDNSAGELPKTGLPLASFALLGLIPLGYKLRSFKSKVSDNASTIWAKKQLGQE